jgi:hypothetical protein
VVMRHLESIYIYNKQYALLDIYFVGSNIPRRVLLHSHNITSDPPGRAFEPVFVFVKVKSQPKGPKATSAFAQKQLFS